MTGTDKKRRALVRVREPYGLCDPGFLHEWLQQLGSSGDEAEAGGADLAKLVERAAKREQAKAAAEEAVGLLAYELCPLWEPLGAASREERIAHWLAEDAWLAGMPGPVSWLTVPAPFSGTEDGEPKLALWPARRNAPLTEHALRWWCGTTRKILRRNGVHLRAGHEDGPFRIEIREPPRPGTRGRGRPAEPGMHFCGGAAPVRLQTAALLRAAVETFHLLQAGRANGNGAGAVRDERRKVLAGMTDNVNTHHRTLPEEIAPGFSWTGRAAEPLTAEECAGAPVSILLRQEAAG